MSHPRERAAGGASSSHPPSTRGSGAGVVGAALLGLVAIAVVGLVMVGANLLAGPPNVPEDDEAVASATVGTSSDGYDVWSRNDDGTPVRWDPCSPVEVVVNGAGAPDGWRSDLDRALDEVADASGIDLEVVGAADERPDVRRPAYQPDRYGDRWAPVLVAWAAPGEGGLPLRATDRGLAIPVAVGVDGDRTYVTGQVVLNRERDDLQVGFDDRDTSWGATLLHELGHLLGLAHADDPDELMAHHPGDGPVELGPGDRAGLRAVGRDAGCRDATAPQPISVPEPRSELDLLREQRRHGS